MNHSASRLRNAILLAAMPALLTACTSGSSGIGEEQTLLSGYTLSGTLYGATGITTDSDINDVYADFTSNDDPAAPQAISNRATVQGFASYSPTRGSISGAAELENFADSYDEDDFFSATLQAGQIIQLQVVDYEGDGVNNYRGDLDLYLYNATSGDLVDSSLLEYPDGQFETVSVPTDGDYVINVSAWTGVSKYVLQVLEGNGVTSVSDAFVPNQVLLRTETGTDGASKARAAGLRIANSGDSSHGPQLLTLNRQGVSAQSLSRAGQKLRDYSESLWQQRQTLMDIKALRQQKGVVYAEPNYIRQPLATPTDPYYSYQWHYRNIELPSAWDLADGSGVIVAVADTGVFLTHEDLSSQLVSGYDFISDSSSARDGNGIDSNPDDPGDSTVAGQSSWHGTHVAGTVAAASNNGKGGAGIASAAKIMPLRVLGQDGGTTYDIIQAVRYAARLSNDSGTLPAQKADIINLSLGGSSSSSAEQEAYNAVMNEGVIIVAAAGNESTSSPSYPASYQGIISVSATDQKGQLAYYSNYGSKIDIAAPGGSLRLDDNNDSLADGIMSTYVDDSLGTRQSAYTYQMQGTSMASPHVAGVIALMKSVYSGLSNTQIQALIQSCAITSKANDSSCVRDNQLGYGQIDAYLAVTEALKLSNGGTLPALPVLLQSSPSNLNFGATSDNLTFDISNGGGSTASISSVSDDADWLTVTAQTVDSSGLGTYLASVDRSGLSDGFYSASITVTDAAGSTVQIDVSLQQGVTSASNLTVQYVILEDADCTADDCIVASIKAGENGSYLFSNVEPGNYHVLAGSDIDVDGYICGAGEICGAYPNAGAMQAISVEQDNRSGVDFLVSLNSGFVGSSLQAMRITPAVNGSVEKTKQVAP